MMQPSIHAYPAVALSCPWCNCPSSPSPSPQECQGCRRAFTLSPGPALDGSVIAPPPHPSAFPIHLKWSIVVTYRFARLEEGGVTSGTLDPVVGMAPIDQVGIAYPDVVSIAVWRRLAWVDLVVGALFRCRSRCSSCGSRSSRCRRRSGSRPSAERSPSASGCWPSLCFAAAPSSGAGRHASSAGMGPSRSCSRRAPRSTPSSFVVAGSPLRGSPERRKTLRPGGSAGRP